MRLRLEVESGSNVVGNLRKELETERMVSKKKSDKLTAYE